jgi:hypothetical protein
VSPSSCDSGYRRAVPDGVRQRNRPDFEHAQPAQRSKESTTWLALWYSQIAAGKWAVFRSIHVEGESHVAYVRTFSRYLPLPYSLSVLLNTLLVKEKKKEVGPSVYEASIYISFLALGTPNSCFLYVDDACSTI